MARHKRLVAAVAIVLGVALAGPVWAADPKPGKVPPKAPLQLKPNVTKIEVPGVKAVPAKTGVFDLVKGQSYTVKVTYSTPPPPPLGTPGEPLVAVASEGLVVVTGGEYDNKMKKWQFDKRFWIKIDPVKPGQSVIKDTPLFQIPTDLSPCCYQFQITAWSPAESEKLKARGR